MEWSPPQIHKHTLTHTPPAVCLSPITAVPARPVPSSPPPGPITTFLILLFLALDTARERERDRRGAPSRPNHGIHRATTAFIFSELPLLCLPLFKLSILPIFWPQAQVIYLGMLNKGKVQHKNRHRTDKQQSN